MNRLTDLARAVYAIAHDRPESEAVEVIEAVLRTTRADGIDIGLDYETRHGDVLHNGGA